MTNDQEQVDAACVMIARIVRARGSLTISKTPDSHQWTGTVNDACIESMEWFRHFRQIDQHLSAGWAIWSILRELDQTPASGS